VYKIDLGVISSAEPRFIKVAFSNYNPVKIPMYLKSSDRPVCVCGDSSWPVGRNDEERAREIVTDMLYGRTMLATENEAKRCFCHSGKEAVTESHDFSSDDDSDGQCTHFELQDVEEETECDSIDREKQWVMGEEEYDESYYDEAGQEQDSSGITGIQSEDTAVPISVGDDAIQSNDQDDDETDVESEDLTTTGGIHEERSEYEEEHRRLTLERDKLKLRLEILIRHRDHLLTSKMKIEKEIESTTAPKQKSKRNSLVSLFGDFVDRSRDVYQVRDAPNGVFPAGGQSDSAANKDRKIQLKKMQYLKHRSRPVGRPLRSLGLLYQCGKMAIGVAQAGYNTLLRIHLNSLLSLSANNTDPPPIDGLLSDVATVKLSTPYRDITVALHYQMCQDKLKSVTYSDEMLHDETTVSGAQSSPSFFIGGSPSSVTVITTLAAGPLLRYWSSEVKAEKPDPEAEPPADMGEYGGDREDRCGLTKPPLASQRYSATREREVEETGSSVKIIIESEKYFLKSFLVQNNVEHGDENDPENGIHDVYWTTVITPLSVCNLFSDSEPVTDINAPYPSHAQSSILLSRIMHQGNENSITDSISRIKREISSKIAESWPLRPSLYTCSNTILSQLPTTNAVDKNHKDELQAQIRSFQSYLVSGYLVKAHSQLMQLQHKWMKMFPKGISLPPVELVTHAPGTLHRHTIRGMTIESPLPLFPVENTISLPPIRPDQLIVFFIKVKNVFEVPVSFALQGKDTYKKWKIGDDGIAGLVENEGEDAKEEEAKFKKGKDREESLDEDVWHDWFQQKCYFKSLVSREHNEFCPLTYQNMNNKTLLYDWYKGHHMDKKQNPKKFYRSSPVYSELAQMKRNNSALDHSGTENIVNSQVVQGTEATVYPDRHYFTALEGAQDGYFLLHPYADMSSKSKASKAGDEGHDGYVTNWVETLKPGETGFLGPIVFLPRLTGQIHGLLRKESFVDSVFVLNSFSGLDKVTLTGVTDMPYMTVKSVAVVSSSPSTKRFTFANSSDDISSIISTETSDALLEKYPIVSGCALSDTVKQVDGNDVRIQIFPAVRIDRYTSDSPTRALDTPYCGSIVEVDSPEDRIVITLQNEGLIDASIIHASWDEEFCTEVSPMWILFALRKYDFRRRIFDLCEDIKLPRIVSAAPPSYIPGLGTSTESDNSQTGQNDSSTWEISFSAKNFLGDCMYERRETNLELYLWADGPHAVGATSAIMVHLSAFLSDKRKKECFNSAVKGYSLDNSLFLLTFTIAIGWSLLTLFTLLVDRGKQVKKRRNILALIKRDYDQSLDREPSNSTPGNIEAAEYPPVARSAPAGSTYKGFLYPHGRINVSDIRRDSTFIPDASIVLVQVLALHEKREKQREKDAMKAMDPSPVRSVSTTPMVSPVKKARTPTSSEKRVRPRSLSSPDKPRRLKSDAPLSPVKKSPPKIEVQEQVDESLPTDGNDVGTVATAASEATVATVVAEATEDTAVTVDTVATAVMRSPVITRDRDSMSVSTHSSSANIHNLVVNTDQVDFSAPASASHSDPSQGLSSSWESTDDNESSATATEAAAEGEGEGVNMESKKHILKDLSWATSTSPLTRAMFTTPIEGPSPSFPLPHLLSLDPDDEEDLVTFSPRNVVHFSNRYADQNTLDMDNGYPEDQSAIENHFPEKIFAVEDFLDTKFSSKRFSSGDFSPRFSDNIFPSENNISGEIAIELLGADEGDDMPAWPKDDQQYRADLSHFDTMINARFINNFDFVNNIDTTLSMTDLSRGPAHTNSVPANCFPVLNNNSNINSAISNSNDMSDLSPNSTTNSKSSGNSNSNSGTNSHVSRLGLFNATQSSSPTGMDATMNNNYRTIRNRSQDLYDINTSPNKMPTMFLSPNTGGHDSTHNIRSRRPHSANLSDTVSHLNGLKTAATANVHHSLDLPRGFFSSEKGLYSDSDAWLRRLSYPQHSSPTREDPGHYGPYYADDGPFEGTGGIAIPHSMSGHRNNAGLPPNLFNREEIEIEENHDWLHEINRQRQGQGGMERLKGPPLPAMKDRGPPADEYGSFDNIPVRTSFGKQNSYKEDVQALSLSAQHRRQQQMQQQRIQEQIQLQHELHLQQLLQQQQQQQHNQLQHHQRQHQQQQHSQTLHQHHHQKQQQQHQQQQLQHPQQNQYYQQQMQQHLHQQQQQHQQIPLPVQMHQQSTQQPPHLPIQKLKPKPALAPPPGFEAH
jgi:hypothetical protein